MAAPVAKSPTPPPAEAVAAAERVTLPRDFMRKQFEQLLQQVPPEWEPQERAVELIELKPGEEYTRVEQHFLEQWDPRHSAQPRIERIHRIQNLELLGAHLVAEAKSVREIALFQRLIGERGPRAAILRNATVYRGAEANEVKRIAFRGLSMGDIDARTKKSPAGREGITASFHSSRGVEQLRRDKTGLNYIFALKAAEGFMGRSGPKNRGVRVIDMDHPGLCTHYGVEDGTEGAGVPTHPRDIITWDGNHFLPTYLFTIRRPSESTAIKIAPEK